MITIRAIETAAPGKGRLLRRYLTENTAEADRNHPGHRIGWSYQGSTDIARSLHIGAFETPTDEHVDNLLEATKAETGEPWTGPHAAIVGFDLTVTPHLSVALAIEFAPSDDEREVLWEAIASANGAAMDMVARIFTPHGVAWLSFENRTAQTTYAVRDGRDGALYPTLVGKEAKPRTHIHNILFNALATRDGEVTRLDPSPIVRQLDVVDGFFQARLADELRRLGVRVGYDDTETQVVVSNIPERALRAFQAAWEETGEVWITETEDALQPHAIGGQ